MVNKNIFNLKGKKSLITGGGGLLGPEHAIALANQGSEVFLIDIDKQGLDKGSERVKKANKSAKVETLKLSDNKGSLLELLHFKNSPIKKKKIIKPYSNGFTHISITVKDIMNVYLILKKIKIKFNSKPMKSTDGKVLMTYCRTPEGAFLELVEELI